MHAGRFNSLALDAPGFAFMSYFHDTGSDVRYTWGEFGIPGRW
jgi:hypothetical protein